MINWRLWLLGVVVGWAWPGCGGAKKATDAAFETSPSADVDGHSGDLPAEQDRVVADLSAADSPEADGQIPPVRRDEQGFEVDPAGTWYAGDLHVHATGASRGCGDQSYPADIKRVALERGLDFVVLTDHSYAWRDDPDEEDDPAHENTGPEFPYWEQAAELSEPGVFLMIDGAEVCPIAEGDAPIDPRGHIGCLPGDLDTFDRSGVFIDRPAGAVTGGEALEQAKERGCFAVIAHSYDLLKPIAYDWTNMDYDALEIWYGTMGYDISDRYAYDAWRCDLLAGKPTVGLGGAACHDVSIDPPGNLLKTALGFPTTSVFAQALTWPALVDGLRKAQVAIHEGDSFLRIDGYDEAKRRAEAATTRFVRLRGRLDAHAPQATLSLLFATACDDPRPAFDPPTVAEQVLFEVPIVGDQTFDEIVAVDGQPGIYSATLLAAGRYYGALSRAIVIAPEAP